MDITLIASGAAFGFAVLCFIAISICIFLYCLNRNKTRRRRTQQHRDSAAIGLQSTPTDSDVTTGTGSESAAAGPASSSVRETSFGNSLYPKLYDGKDVDTKDPPPSYEDSATALPPTTTQELTPEKKYQVCYSLGVSLCIMGILHYNTHPSY